MAYDLAPTPTIGLNVVLDGDAHLGNFGLYGTPQRELVFDLNDFDEAIVGPWEWDLKRLTASVNVAGRENGLSASERAAAVRQTVMGYQKNMRRLETMGTLDIWYLHSFPGRANILRKVPAKAQAVIEKVVAKALASHNQSLLEKVAGKDGAGLWRFREDPPILTRVSAAKKESLINALETYSLTLTHERRYMLSRYRVADAAHRVVGIGSVGTRAYLLLLMGKTDSDPLLLQVKEACVPAHAAYLPLRKAKFPHEGKRVVVGQRALQASSDVMLGWTEMDGRPFYVRQMKNLKASVPIEWLTGEAFNFYCWACGTLLARAHALVYALVESDCVHDGSQTTFKAEDCCGFDFVAVCAAFTAPSYAPRKRTRRIYSRYMFSVRYRSCCDLSLVLGGSPISSPSRVSVCTI
jgi:uncharacterized protein (DUF2252 family)